MVRLYTVSPRVLEEHQTFRAISAFEGGITSTTTSLDRLHPLKHLMKHGRRLGINKTIGGWSAYIDHFMIRCLTPLGLLGDLVVQPDSVDVFIVDAEGYDVELLEAVLIHSNFAPS